MIKPCHVLIISQNTLFLEALTRIIQPTEAHVTGQVADLSAALPFFQEQRVNAVIIDPTGVPHSEWEIVSYLQNYTIPVQVIFLKPEGDLMTIYRREQQSYTAPNCLTQLLCGPKG